jgi:hypothetical protein
MADGFIVRRGGKVSEQALAPTITETETTISSFKFTLKNNDTDKAIIRYRIDDINDEGEIIELAGGATSSNITVSGLNEGTEYTVFATANVTGKVKSNVTQLAIETEGFSPADLSNLFVWYDASQITGLSNNDSVATWSDLSGNSRDLTQSTPGARPTYKTNQRNGLPIVSFDGSDDFMTASFTGGQQNTYFVVCRYTNLDAGNKMVFDSNNSSNRQTYFQSSGENLSRIFAGSLANVANSVSSNYEYLTLVFNTTSSFGRISGNQSGTLNPGAQSITNLTMGAEVNRSSFSPLDVAEFIMYNKVCSTAEITTVENYLKDKWGFS